jgi:hypothetical protein
MVLPFVNTPALSLWHVQVIGHKIHPVCRPQNLSIGWAIYILIKGRDVFNHPTNLILSTLLCCSLSLSLSLSLALTLSRSLPLVPVLSQSSKLNSKSSALSDDEDDGDAGAEGGGGGTAATAAEAPGGLVVSFSPALSSACSNDSA